METPETPDEPDQQKPSIGKRDNVYQQVYGDLFPYIPPREAFSKRLQYSLDRLSQAKPGDVQEIAASQIQLLTDYYNLVLLQAARSFRWALIAAGIGLLFFLAAVTFLIVRQPEQLATIS